MSMTMWFYRDCLQTCRRVESLGCWSHRLDQFQTEWHLIHLRPDLSSWKPIDRLYMRFPCLPHTKEEDCWYLHLTVFSPVLIRMHPNPSQCSASEQEWFLLRCGVGLWFRCNQSSIQTCDLEQASSVLPICCSFGFLFPDAHPPKQNHPNATPFLRRCILG